MSRPIDKKSRTYDNIFFDLDGTLTDPKEGITKCIQFALEKIGLHSPPADDLEWCIGPPLKRTFAEIIGSADASLIDEALKFYRQRFVEKGMFENVPYAGVKEMLDQLQQEGYRLFVVTSKPEIYAIQIIEYFGFTRYFEKIYGAGLDGTRSDKSHLLKFVLEQHSFNHPSAMVGDRKFDVIAAIDNQVDPIGVLYGYGSLEELKDAGALHVCATPMVVYERMHR